MKYIIAVLISFVLWSTVFSDSNEEAKVQQVYQAYRSALLTRDGISAWKRIDSRTKDYYDEIARDCLSIKREELNRLDLLSKIMILRLRLEFRRDKLQTFDGAKIFIIGVEKGWISRSSVQAIKKIDRITIDRDLAQGFLVQAPNFPAIRFDKEDDGWKVALWKSFELGNASLQQTIKQKGMSEEKFLKIILGQLSKYKVDDQIFNGPLK